MIILCVSALVLVSILFAPGRGIVWEQIRHWKDRRDLSGTQVLTTLYGLATRHKDPAYPCEQGMIDTYHGLGTRRALARLLERGLVRQTAHMPTEGVH